MFFVGVLKTPWRTFRHQWHCCARAAAACTGIRDANRAELVKLALFVLRLARLKSLASTANYSVLVVGIIVLLCWNVCWPNLVISWYFEK